MILEQLIRLIREIAEIPSFSSYEEIIHPYILEKTKELPGIKVHNVPDNNLILEIPGRTGARPVALSAHLDKINHFGEDPPLRLPFKEETSYLEGQMDDAVGLGICLGLALQSREEEFPPLLLLLSEMEESFGLKKHPHLLKSQGEGLHHGIGAERISEFLINEGKLPSCVITVDTTPLFRGAQGIVVYSKHWHFTKAEPSDQEKQSTEKLVGRLTKISPGLTLSNNTNDYLTYGKCLNQGGLPSIPSIAIEPAIYPYHQANERVFLDDIEGVYSILRSFLLDEAKQARDDDR